MRWNSLGWLLLAALGVVMVGAQMVKAYQAQR